MDKIKEPGYVYILTNPSFREDWIKIGKSARPVDVRSKELDNTAVPLPFEIYATFRTVKYNEVEKLVHRSIDRFTHLRIRQNREFFNVSLQVALDIFRDIAQTIDDAVITVYSENKHEESPNQTIQDIVKKGKREKFTINGKGAFYKNGCMVEVIRQYIKEKSLTYQEIKIFLMRGYLIWLGLLMKSKDINKDLSINQKIQDGILSLLYEAPMEWISWLAHK